MARQGQMMCSVGKRVTTPAGRQLCRFNLILEQPLPANTPSQPWFVFTVLVTCPQKLTDVPWNPSLEGKLHCSPVLRRVCKDLAGIPKGL